ncbi:MAG: TonB-dependent receptor [Verrucomicrobia bacterium]|nr:TonB-dependent receptor [Verrucomicrobiota bacterium]
MQRQIPSTHEKALQINLDASAYGAFAEIGAGQEVARWFFRVGGAAGTIAKTISAYDMTVSDAIYGPCERYVSRHRLQTMLAYEYDLHQQRLHLKRGASTRFFALANTVAARSYSRLEDWHGWLGIRFQTRPLAPPSDIIIHVRMHDRDTVQQQEALGIMGVNLVYAALYLHERPEKLLQALMDNLSPDRVEVDLIKFSGPNPQRVDNRLMALHLVQLGFTNAALFTADGEVVQAAEVLYKRPILVERGRFRPVTLATADMLECARAEFVREPQVRGQDIVVLMEMTLKNLSEGGVIDPKDFLDRVDILGALGQTVLISNYGEFHRLASYLFRYTKQMIGIVMGAPTLQELFEEKYYADLEGGVLESFGRLFRNNLKVYVYPFKDPTTGELLSASHIAVAPRLRHLYAYLKENHHIQGLRHIHREYLPVFSDDVLERIRQGDRSWETMVPPQVAQMIQQRQLFGYRPTAPAPTATPPPTP